MAASPHPDAPTLAVVIPARNVADTIAEQLEALAAQDWDGIWEIVVVDNGSTDGTAAVVDRFRNGPVPIRVVPATDGASASYARNVGVAATEAPAVVFCDGDDIVAPGWLAAFAAALADAEFVSGRCELDRLNREPFASMRGRGDEKPETWFHGCFPVARGNGFGIRRETLARLGGFDESEEVRTTEDHDLSLRAWLAGVHLVFVPDAVVHYRYRTDLRSLWRQGYYYGRGRPLFRRRLREAGRPAPSPWAGLRSWVWLVLHLYLLASADGRARWVWVFANRAGQIVGSIKYRSLLL